MNNNIKTELDNQNICDDCLMDEAYESISYAYDLLSKTDDWSKETLYENREEKSYALANLNDTNHRIDIALENMRGGK
jgi:hypothetical protein